MRYDLMPTVNASVIQMATSARFVHKTLNISRFRVCGGEIRCMIPNTKNGPTRNISTGWR